MYPWWSFCTLYLLACQVTVTVGDSSLCCYVPCLSSATFFFGLICPSFSVDFKDYTWQPQNRFCLIERKKLKCNLNVKFASKMSLCWSYVEFRKRLFVSRCIQRPDSYGACTHCPRLKHQRYCGMRQLSFMKIVTDESSIFICLFYNKINGPF